jgi:putative AlgH/UPF0301 family transcriptional regulator
MECYHLNNLAKRVLATSRRVKGFFEKTVVYIHTHDQNGAKGIVMNRCFTIDEPKEIYVGGPCEKDARFMLELIAREDMAWIKNAESIRTIRPETQRLFQGHAVWESSQLEEEVLEGDWFITKLTAADCLSIHRKRLYQHAIETVGITVDKMMAVEGSA